MRAFDDSCAMELHDEQHVDIWKSSMVDVTLLIKAYDCAREKHFGQYRKDAARTPAIEHPVKVFRLLYELGGVRNTTALVSALLHDTIEDAGVSPEFISEQFGQTICDVVDEVSDDKNLAKDERKERQIARAAKLSDEASYVRIADKIANVEDVVLSPPIGWSLERRLQYIFWAQAVVRNLRFHDSSLVEYFDRIAWDGIQYLRGQRASPPARWKCETREREIGLDFGKFDVG